MSLWRKRIIFFCKRAIFRKLAHFGRLYDLVLKISRKELAIWYGFRESSIWDVCDARFRHFTIAFLKWRDLTACALQATHWQHYCMCVWPQRAGCLGQTLCGVYWLCILLVNFDKSLETSRAAFLFASKMYTYELFNGIVLTHGKISILELNRTWNRH